MSCAACIKVDCAETSSLPKYLGGYSLSNGTFAQNAQPITVTTTNQTGPTTITFPPGSIQLSIPTPVPTSPFTFVAVMKQCQASFTIQIPPTQSAAFFDEVIAALAQQLGDCLNSTSATPGGGSIHQYVNSPQTISCPGGSQMLLCNPSLYFPQGITFNSAGNGSLTIAGGICVASTLASANQGALNLLQAFLTNMINSQNMVCGGTCPASCAQALSSLNWTITNTNNGFPDQPPNTTPPGTSSGSASGGVLTFDCDATLGGNGALTFTAIITNSTNNNCVYNVVLDVTPVFSGNGFTEIDFPGTVSGVGGFCAYESDSSVEFNTFPGTLPVPANSSVNLEVLFYALATTAISGTITISPA